MMPSAGPRQKQARTGDQRPEPRKSGLFFPVRSTPGFPPDLLPHLERAIYIPHRKMLAFRALAFVVLASTLLSATNAEIPCMNPPCTGPVVLQFYATSACTAIAPVTATSLLPKDWKYGECRITEKSSSAPASRHESGLAVSDLMELITRKVSDMSAKDRAVFDPSYTSESWTCNSTAIDDRRLLLNTWEQKGCTGRPDTFDYILPGACLNTTMYTSFPGPTSAMVMCSVPPIAPAKPLIPAAAPQNYPALLYTEADCPKNGPCGVAWMNIYSDPDCQNVAQTLNLAPLNTTTQQTVSLGNCYTTLGPFDKPAYNTKYWCADGVYTQTNYISGCSGTPFQEQGHVVNKCQRRGDSSWQYFCAKQMRD